MMAENKNLIYAVLTNCCSTDVCRPILGEPFAKGGNVYASDGRICVRYAGVEGVAPDATADHKNLPASIDGFVEIDSEAVLMPEISSYGIALASYLSMSDVLKYSDKAPDDEGYTSFDEDVDCFALVRVGGKYFRAAYLRRITDALSLLGEMSPYFYMKKDMLVVRAGRVRFGMMAVRDVPDDSPDHAIVDASTGEFVHHLSSWMA